MHGWPWILFVLGEPVLVMMAPEALNAFTGSRFASMVMAYDGGMVQFQATLALLFTHTCVPVYTSLLVTPSTVESIERVNLLLRRTTISVMCIFITPRGEVGAGLLVESVTTMKPCTPVMALTTKVPRSNAAGRARAEGAWEANTMMLTPIARPTRVAALPCCLIIVGLPFTLVVEPGQFVFRVLRALYVCVEPRAQVGQQRIGAVKPLVSAVLQSLQSGAPLCLTKPIALPHL
jgi:hypothetical protein